MMWELQRSKPPEFDGQGIGLKAETWLLDMGRFFSLLPYGSNIKARCAITQLRGHGSIWWDGESERLGINVADLTWEIFEERFREKFLSPQYREARIDEFHELKQGFMTVDQYEKKFLGLKQYSSYRHDDALIIQHFVRGLRDTIIGDVRAHQPRTLALAVENERIIERNVARGYSGKFGSQNQSAQNSR